MSIIAIVWMLAAILILLLIARFLERTNSKYRPSKLIIYRFISIYNLLDKIPYIHKKFYKIRIKLYNSKFDEDWIIRYKTILYLAVSWIVAIVFATFILVFFNNNAYVTMTLLFFTFYIKNSILDRLIGDDTGLLEDLINFLKELEQSFHITRDVHIAVKEASDNTDTYALNKHIRKIDNVIDNEKRFNRYIRNCPNVFFKLLATTLKLTNEYGDRRDAKNSSAFKENIYYINRNIWRELFNRDKLRYGLKSMPILCILPLLFFSPVEYLFHKYFNDTDMFYKTSIGFVIKIIVTVICVLSFYIIRSYSETHKKELRIKDSFWEAKLLKSHILVKFIKAILPKEQSPRWFKYKNKISSSGVYTKIEYIYLRKLLLAISGFLITISICLTVNSINYFSILNDQTARFRSDAIAINSEQVESVDIENKLLERVDLNNTNKSYSILKEELKNRGVYDESTCDKLANKIINKKAQLDKQNYLKVYELLAALVISLIAWKIPNIFLNMRVKIRNYDMQNEVVLFETVVLIMMNHATSESIIKTMSVYSNIFKTAIDKTLKCLRTSDKGGIKILIKKVNYPPFTNLIENLIKAEDIGVKEAFINLSDDRRRQLDRIDEEEARMVNERVRWCEFVLKVAFEASTFLYIIGGVVYTAIVRYFYINDLLSKL